MKILTVVGARPQFVKAAAVSRALKNASVEEVIVHTGQHFNPDMSDVFFREMEIPSAKYLLDINNLSHGAMTGRMMEALEKVMMDEMPDWVLVYGDTNSTLAGALVAAKLHIPIAHVEAGLRSFNNKMPEEINRILTDRISSLLLCPTKVAKEHLEREGFSNFKTKIEVCGDVMLDAALFYSDKTDLHAKVAREITYPKFALATLHRAENTNDLSRLREICEALQELHRKLPVVLPLHPRTGNLLKDQNIKLDVHVLPPIGYFDMLALLKKTKLVLTDSGGLQKEAYFFKKPCVILRDETEWLELVESGTAILAGSSRARILESFEYFQSSKINFESQFYGDGKASQKIVESLKNLKLSN